MEGLYTVATIRHQRPFKVFEEILTVCNIPRLKSENHAFQNHASQRLQNQAVPIVPALPDDQHARPCPYHDIPPRIHRPGSTRVPEPFLFQTCLCDEDGAVDQVGAADKTK